MKSDGLTRQSVCTICGKRLSSKTPNGDIHWHTSHLDDKGLYCDACYKPKGTDKPRKTSVHKNTRA
jgi:hypothetical protein